MDFYTPRNIGPADQVLFDAVGNAVGIQPAASSSPPVLGFNPTTHAAVSSLVSTDWNSDTPGGALRRVLSNVIGHKIPGINISVGAAAGRTYCMKIALPAEFDAIQLVHYHHETAGTTVYSAAIAATETAAADTSTNRYQPILGGSAQTALNSTTDAVGWRSVTWSGAADITPAAASGEEAPVVTVSDWIDCASVPRADGGTLPLLLVRLAALSGTSSFFTAGAGSEVPTDANQGLIVNGGAFSDTGVMVTAPGSNTPTGGFSYSMPALGIRLRSRKLGLTIMGIGDSITQFSAITTDKVSSWGFRAAAALTALGLPCGWVNAGVSSFPPATYWATGKETLPLWEPSIAVFAGWSPNDGNFSTEGDARYKAMKMASRVADFIDTATAAGALPMVATGLPCSSGRITTAAIDAVRLAHNERLLQLEGRGIGVLDWSGILNDGATPQRLPVALKFDDTHPNDAGCQLQADQLLAAIKSAFGIA